MNDNTVIHICDPKESIPKTEDGITHPYYKIPSDRNKLGIYPLSMNLLYLSVIKLIKERRAECLKIPDNQNCPLLCS